MADPRAMITVRRLELDALTERSRQRMRARLHRAGDQIDHLRAQVLSLSPLSTLERGYAVVQHADGRIVTDRADVDPDELLRVRVARGDFGVRPVSERQ
jgi:exodeoxyribonuclease VII large subunit